MGHIQQVQHASAPVDLFGKSSAPFEPGYATEVFSPSEEKALVRQFGRLPFKPFEFHGHSGNRRIVSYGYRYDYAARSLRAADAMPDFLLPLRDAASRFSGIPAAAFAQALVTEYAPGAGIGWHRDKHMFGEIVGLSFLAPCSLRLRRRLATGWQRKTLQLAARSAYLLRGEVRDAWEHSILPMDALRYSVTFRTFRA